MAIPAVQVQPVDPQMTINNPVRSLAGPILSGNVSLDADYGVYSTWVYVGTTGNLTYVKWDGSTQLLINVAAGVWHPIHSVRMNSVGTTAGGLVWGA